MSTLDHLPVHPVPPEVQASAGSESSLLVDGLVDRPWRFTPAELAGLRRGKFDDNFVCLEGWTVEDLHWEGVPLADILLTAGVLPEGAYVRVGSGGFTIPLPMETAQTAVLCDTLDGEPLTLEHGAPWRLILPGGACFTSVKWVDHIEVVTTPGDNTAKEIASARLA